MANYDLLALFKPPPKWMRLR